MNNQEMAKRLLHIAPLKGERGKLWKLILMLTAHISQEQGTGYIPIETSTVAVCVQSPLV